MSHVASADPGAAPGVGNTQVRIRDTRSWIASLPLADSVTSAERLYRALSDLNRRELEPGHRLDLMELYAQPVVGVSTALQAPWAYLRLPMAPKARQRAEFLRNLHGEMACGYQYALRDLFKAHHPWDRKAAVCLAAERAMHQLGEVLLRSYQVYMPGPAGVWREIHALYRLVEERGLLDHPLTRVWEDAGARVTVRNTYLRVLLLGLCGPYQAPQKDCLRINAFLWNWADKASIGSRPGAMNPAGLFLVDLSADVPARPVPKETTPAAGPNLRVLATFGLARAVHELIQQLRGREPVRRLAIGFDCSDSGCIDVLRHMVRFWGVGAYRQYPRRSARDSELSLCVGLKALHFFSSGRKLFTPPLAVPTDHGFGYRAVPKPQSHAGERNVDEAFIDLDGGNVFPEPGASNPAQRQPAEERFHTHQWDIGDESASGLALAHRGGGVSVRVGDLVGIRGLGAGGWSVGVVRRLTSPDTARVDIGVKMLAPGALPVAVKPADDATLAGYVPALRLAEIPAVCQPPTLLLDRGLASPGKDLELLDEENGSGPPCRVRVLKVIRCTASFEQVVFTPVCQP